MANDGTPTAPTPTQTSSRNGWVNAAAVFAFAVVLFAPSLGYRFAYDDYLQIMNNPQVTGAAASFESLSRVFTEQTPGHFYRPLTTFTYWLTYLAAGPTPWIYHLENVLLYGVVCVLAFLLVRGMSGDERVGLVAGLLFAAHPVHVEAVANIIGRAELLAAGLSLGALVTATSAFAGETPRVRLVALSGFAYFCALLAKESAVAALGLLPFCVGVSPIAHFTWADFVRVVRRVAPFMIVTLVALGLRYVVLRGSFLQGSGSPIQVHWENPLLHLAPADRFRAALVVLGEYVRLLVLPIHLSADYSRMPARVLEETTSVAGAFSIILAFVPLALAVVYRKRIEAFYLLWFYITFSVASNLIVPNSTIMGERLAFMPSLGIVAFLASVAVRRAGWATRAVVAFAVILALRTVTRMPVWYDNSTLFQATLADAPHSPKAYYNYGVHLLDEQHRPSEAKAYFERTLEFYPEHILSLWCLGDIALEEKRFEDMAGYYRRILAINPNHRVREELDRYEAYRERLAR